jgi:GNAT superfamily N-acetyltransferase
VEIDAWDDGEVVVCRPALHRDTGQVLELSSHIWDGGDYIPSVWADWLADPDGMLGVAEMGGRVVGVFKLTKFQEHEWYMEGLRVHPDVWGKGIARHIHDYVVETWHLMGDGLIRLVTGSYNIKIHQMCQSSGFRRIAEFLPYRAPVLPEETAVFKRLSSEEASQAMEFVTSSPTHALSWNLINLGWVYGDLQLKHLNEVINAGHAWWWRGGKGFLSIWEDEEDGGHDPGIQLLGCPMEDLPELLLDYRRWMGQLGYHSAGWIAPNQPGVLACLENAGFQRSWDLSLYVFELRA